MSEPARSGREGYTATVDLGGGELGSAGNNRIVGNATGEVQIINGHVVAKNNWWGGSESRVELQGDDPSFDAHPVLESDPRSEYRAARLSPRAAR